MFQAQVPPEGAWPVSSFYHMALIAHLKFGDNTLGRYTKEYPALSVRSGFYREHDGIRPGTFIRSINFTVEVIAPDNLDIDLYSWYIDEESREGCITMEESSGKDFVHLRTIEFENARCYGFSEKYDISERHRRKLVLEFSATGAKTEGLDIIRQKRIL